MLFRNGGTGAGTAMYAMRLNVVQISQDLSVFFPRARANSGSVEATVHALIDDVFLTSS